MSWHWRTGPAATPRNFIVILGLLSAFGPLSMDLYLPSLPSLIADLGTSDAMGQATMSASMLGLAMGQLILGPMSDRYGRRWPLIGGVAAFALLSFACALAPTIEALVAIRLLQGLGGSAGVVICRAIVRDLYSGRESAKAFALLSAILTITPVIAPLIGGLLALFTDWRGVFVALGLIGALLMLTALFAVPDTLSGEHRSEATLGGQLVEIGRVMRTPRLFGFGLVLGLASLALFGYISMSSIVFQEQYGLSPQQFSIMFAINAAGIGIGTMLGRRLVDRFSLVRIAVAAVLIATVASATFTVLAFLDAPIGALLVPLFFAIFVHGVVLSNVTAIAMEPYQRGAGTASAWLGAMQMGVGAFVPPLASLGGVNAVVMGGTMAAGTFLALLLLVLLTRPKAAS